MSESTTRILLELRPAFDGHAGIPQETRLLFRNLAIIDGLTVDGLLQSSNQMLARGLPSDRTIKGWPEDRRINRLSRVVISIEGQSDERGPLLGLRRSARRAWHVVGAAIRGLMPVAEKLSRFEAKHFEDYIWRSLFAKTLPYGDYALTTTAHYRVAQVPWSLAHATGLISRYLGIDTYLRLNTDGYQVMVAETPYPGRVSAGTQLVVRYHDAIPLLMPHTITNRAFHQAAHYHALRRNVRDGAWFACVSDATRRDLISVFPEAAPRAVTIPNMVSHSYFAEDSPMERVADVLRTRANDGIHGVAASPAPRAHVRLNGEPYRYLLMVSTLEPRKNHLGLLSAWERLIADGHPELQIVLVGMLGWESKTIMRRLLPWVAREQVHLLSDVPASEMRVLYRHAAVTVCPSFGEGFGFSGVEAMRCGGIVAASDLAVHREIYGCAARYFNPYSEEDMARTLSRLIDPASSGERQRMIDEGARVSAQYLPESILGRWQELFARISPIRDRPAKA